MIYKFTASSVKYVEDFLKVVETTTNNVIYIVPSVPITVSQQSTSASKVPSLLNNDVFVTLTLSQFARILKVDFTNA